MKKIAIVLLALGVSTAFAQTPVCDGTSNQTKKQIAGGSGAVVSSPTFIRNGFDFNCSNNVLLSYDEVSANLFQVGSGSTKGNQYFAGNSNGGAIAAKGPCTGTNKACGAGDITSALAAAGS